MVGNSKEISAPAEKAQTAKVTPEGSTARSTDRPFGQREYDDLKLFKPTLKGPHYKFTILLPVTERLVREKKEKEVFTTEDLDMLIDLFCKDFRGETTYEEVKGPPKIRGYWVGEGGERVINGHVRMEVYTKQHPRAIEYFEELKARLLEHVDRVRHMKQEEIVIERDRLDFVRKRALKSIITESEERLKNLKR